MDIFIVDVPNRPGELARTSQALSDEGVNIESVAGLGGGESAVFGILSNNDALTTSTLDQAGERYRTVACVTVNLPHRPGELAKITKRLADAGVNLEFVAPAGLGETVTIALGVSDPDAARAALGQT